MLKWVGIPVRFSKNTIVRIGILDHAPNAALGYTIGRRDFAAIGLPRNIAPKGKTHHLQTSSSRQ